MSSAPVYLKIKQRLLRSIEAMPVNAPIASERELAFKYQSSRMTVRRAIDELVDEGVLYRDKNRGTFVADRKLLKKNTSTEALQNKEESDYRIIYYSVKTADKQMAPYLGINPNDQMLRIVRINEKNGCPTSAEELYFIGSILMEERSADLKELLNLQRYIQEGSVTQRFTPAAVPVKYANLLGVKTNEPIIMVESTIMNKAGQIMVYIREYNHPQKVIEITT